MHDEIGEADQKLADIGKVVLPCITVQQMGADNIRFAVIHGDQAVETAGIRTERTGYRQAALQMGSQNIEGHILPGNHYVRYGRLHRPGCRLVDMKRRREGSRRQNKRYACLQRDRGSGRTAAAGILLISLQIRVVHPHLLADTVGRQLTFFDQIIYL
ncbi:hypothetical protein D3C75_396180 [compost metagenome]